MSGEIVSLSDDSFDRGEGNYVYMAIVKLNGASNPYVFDKLSSGMTAMVEVHSGKRRIIDFFLAKMKIYSDESFKER